ncbi:MAG: response regulator, partial [Calditrichaeota bacterium]
MPNTSAHNNSQTTVLLVEDNVDHAFLVKACLDKVSGYMLEIARSTAQCDELLREKTFDIILLDYDLPNEDGLTLLKRLNSYEHVDCPIVVVTGHGHEELAVEAMKAGAADYVVKSGHYPGILPKVITRALEKDRMAKEKRRLAQEVLVRNRELEVLNSITEVLNRSLVSGEMLQTVVQRISELMHLDTTAIYLPEAGQPDATLHVAGGNERVAKDQALLAGFQKLRELTQLLIFNDLSDGHAEIFQQLKQRGLRSGILIPLRHKSDWMGYFLAASSVTAFFTERVVKILTAIANQLGIAIANARLFRQTENLKNKLENVFNSSIDPILTLDEQARIVFFNQRFPDYCGYPEKEIAGRPFLDFVAESRRELTSSKLTELQAGQSSIYETEIHLRDGTALPCLISQSPIKGQREFLMVIKDVSDIARLQKR